MRSIHAHIVRAVIWFARYRLLRGGALTLALLSLGCGVIIEPSLSAPGPAASAIDVVGSSETNTQTTLETAGTVDITGGITAETNLFHRFEQFDLDSNEAASFITDAEIQNIFGQITGGLSTIDGQISVINSLTQEIGSAHLYLINPAGILFGENVQLNLAGDFTATTATLLDFGNKTFRLGEDTSSQSYSEFLEEPTGFAFNGSGPIANLGLLRVADGQIISLLGSNVLNLGEIEAPGGGIRLAAIEDGTMVQINQADSLLSLEISVDDRDPLVSSPTTVAELLTGQDSNIANYLSVVDGEVRLTTDLGDQVIIPDDAKSAIASGNLSVTNHNNAAGGTIDLFGTQVGVLGGSLEASGIQGGTIRVGSEYQDRGTASIYIDNRSSLSARGGYTNSQSGAVEGNGGEIVFREYNANSNGLTFIYDKDYISQIYGKLNVGSSAVEGEGGTVRLMGANSTTLYLADTDLRAASGNDGSMTFEAENIEIRDVQNLQSYENGADSLFAKPKDIRNTGYADSSKPYLFVLPQTTLQSLNNVEVFAQDDITLRNLVDGRLTFPDSSRVSFWVNRDDGNRGTFEMTETGHSLVAPRGDIKIQSSETGNLMLRDITTQRVDSVIAIGEPERSGVRDRIRLMSNSITFDGGSAGDGDRSLTTRSLWIRPTRNDDTRRGIQIGGSRSPAERDELLYLRNDITDVLVGDRARLHLGSGPTEEIFLSEDISFSHSVKLRSQNLINAGNSKIEAQDNASLSLLAGGDITINDIAVLGSGSLDIDSTSGNIKLGEILMSPDPLGVEVGDILISSSAGSVIARQILVDNHLGNRGGDITLEAGNRVFVDSGSSASIRTDSGQVRIQYGAEESFSIGIENGGRILNGTTGNIASDENELRNIEITSLYDEGGITIVPPGASNEPVSPDPVDPMEPESPIDSKNSVDPVNPASNTESTIINPVDSTVFVSQNEPGSNTEQTKKPMFDLEQINYSEAHLSSSIVESSSNGESGASLFSQLEERSTSQFQEYLEIANTVNVATLKDAQDVLSQVSQSSTEKPALVYVYYVPSAEHEDSVVVAGELQGRADDQLEVMLVTAEGAPIRRRQWGVSRAQVERVAAEFRREATSQFSMPRDYLPSAQQLFQWMIAPIEEEIESQAISSLAFIMGDGLRTIPIAALHDGQNFLIEDYSLGLMPTFSLTDFGLGGDHTEATPKVLAMGASRFEQQSPLPAVASELALISEELWLPGASFLNENFTLDNLKSQVASHQYDILHLATHAVFKSGDLNQSYIQLWDDRLNLSDMDSIGLSQADISLIILSACSTALGDRNSEYGFAGLAVNAGSRSALASLWPVSDEGTLGFMTQFYQQLPTAELRSEALRAAQLNMLRGKVGIDRGQIYGPNSEIEATIPELAASGSWDFSHPFYWSAFTLIGSPW